MSSDNPLFILYGSATGNAESIAKDLAARYEKDPSLLPSPFTNVLCLEGNQFKKKCLPIWDKEPTCPQTSKYGVVVVMSTTGNGDAPENGARFVRYIKKKPTIETKPMKHIAYGVLALGDTNYDKFCASGILVDKKLFECGGERVRKLTMADEGTGNMEAVVEEFLETIVQQVADCCLKNNTNTNHDGDGNDNGNGESHESKEEEEEIKENGNDHVNGTANVDKSNETTTGGIPVVPSSTAITTNKITNNGTNQSSMSKDLMSYNGVSLVQHLLSTSSGEKEESIPVVDAKTIPTIGSSLAKCEILPDNYNAEETTASLIAEADRMTISSASSSNIHYTLNHPYESTIVSARYLTKTKVDGVKKASNALSGERKNDDYDIKVRKAINDIQGEFSISSPGSNSSTDEKIFDQNGKRVIELKLGLPGDFTLEYQPGDSIGFVPSNSTTASQYLLSLLEKHHKIRPAQYVAISGKAPMTVKELVCDYLDLCSPIKNKRLLVSLAKHATDENEVKALNYLASSESSSQDLFKTLVDEQRICVVDVMKLFPSCQTISLDALVAILPRIPPRYYSICSSPLKENGHSTLTVAFSVVDYMTPQLQIDGNPQRRVGGLVTTYLEAICSSMILNDDTSKNTTFDTPKVKIFPKPTADFRLPSSLNTPMILIGPGTGIAPFIGFLEHRQAQIDAKNASKTSNSVTEGTWRGGFEMEEEQADPTPSSGADKKIHGDIDLYFGCRYSDHDWLYKDEMKAFQSSNILSSLELAFSRDDANKKCYVQDKIEENASRLASMVINDNATIYICGDGNAMAKDVQSGIQRALDSYTSSEAEAKAITIEALKESGRLLMDIWS